MQDIRQNGLNLALTSVLNANDQSIVLDKFGLWGRSMTDDGNFDPEQVRLINNLLVFTDDNWQTAKAALGKIKMPDSENYAYGLIADVIIGQLVASSELVISNESNTFRVDAGGAELINAYFKLTSGNGRSQIVLDPNDNSAIRIQTDTGGGFEDKFYVDLSGNIVAEDIKTNSGTIGGWNIKEDGLYSNWGDYIRSDGYGKLSLMTYTPSSAVFDGNIYARNLLDKVQHVNMGNNSVDTEQLFNSAISTPKLQSGCVSRDKLSWEVEELIAEKATIAQLEAAEARINRLVADEISAVNADISNLSADIAEIDRLVAKKADISTLNTEIANVKKLIADDAKIKNLAAVVVSSSTIRTSQLSMNGHPCIPITVLTGGNVTTTKTEVVYKVDFDRKKVYTTKVVTAASLTNMSDAVCVGHY